MDTNDEKRKITRVDYPVRGQVEYNGTLIQGEIINFSLNGLLFRADEGMNISEQAKVAVAILWDDAERGTVSTIHCIVARRINYILGLQFDIIDYDTLMLLKERLTAKMGDRVNEEFINFMMGSK